LILGNLQYSKINVTQDKSQIENARFQQSRNASKRWAPSSIIALPIFLSATKRLRLPNLVGQNETKRETTPVQQNNIRDSDVDALGRMALRMYVPMSTSKLPSSKMSTI
jgi:hypothetical protein